MLDWYLGIHWFWQWYLGISLLAGIFMGILTYVLVARYRWKKRDDTLSLEKPPIRVKVWAIIMGVGMILVMPFILWLVIAVVVFSFILRSTI